MMNTTKWLVYGVGSLIVAVGSWATPRACSIDLAAWRMNLRDQTQTASAILIARIDSTKAEGSGIMDSTLLRMSKTDGLPRSRFVTSLTLETIWKGQPRVGRLVMHYITRDGATCGADVLPSGWRVLVFVPSGEILPPPTEDDYYPRFELTLLNTVLLAGHLPLEDLVKSDEDVQIVLKTLQQMTAVMSSTWGMVKRNMR